MEEAEGEYGRISMVPGEHTAVVEHFSGVVVVDKRARAQDWPRQLPIAKRQAAAAVPIPITTTI
jgi:hypothetical protein